MNKDVLDDCMLSVIAAFLASQNPRAIITRLTACVNGHRAIEVHQGLILGPLFFLLFINDLLHSNPMKTTLFS